ncbi:DUF6701 domain-containing protein [Pseudoduganella aquatica]|uniref:DUF11 domain-containing protein n=1 Tax=Pseudoduganella aquatica TaxID=2660641 RepID=A0A7X4HCU6_9BURK|nr:DUF6701 domain-containing protein [Pseudoduganella aquatica]MYN07895.1 hypothetical protein [Pseudoduganella aquatica]
MRALRKALLAGLGALLLAAPAARADTPIKQVKAFAGNINFTGTEKSMRTLPNPSGNNGGDACAVDEGTLNMSLTGLPSGSTVLSAQLYWAGSNSAPQQYTVNFDGVTVTAPAARQFSLNYVSAGVSRPFFAGAADVTGQVRAKGNAVYTVGGLAIVKGAPYCTNQTVLGGFQLLVVYSLPSETFRVLNIYEGFQFISNSSQSLVLSNFQTPNPIGTVTGRVGHITWEGDATLNDSEYLQYNGVAMQDTLNNSDNQFNSASSIDNNAASYGIDFDAYTVRSPVIKGGDTQAITTYRSGQDLVLLNAEIIAAPNVPATDRSITMTLNNTLAPSLPSIYTITVGNNGPLTETGPIVVRDTLPASLIYTGASGTGWTCGMAAQVVTCTYSGTMATGTTLPPITLRVTPAANASGLVSNTARVSGSLFDYDSSNNSATVSVRVGQGGILPVYVFTDGVCRHGLPFNDSGQTCKRISLTTVTANEAIPMFVTYTVNEVPTSLDTVDTTVKMKFALSCHNPATANGRKASFTPRGASAIPLELCAQSGLVPASSAAEWGSAFRDVVLPANSPTSAVIYEFNYADAGRVELLAIDQAGKLGSTDPFVSRPRELQLTTVTSVGITPSRNNQAGWPTASLSDGAFVPAGSTFRVQVQAMSGGITPVITPNFGREDVPVVLTVKARVATDASGEFFPDMDKKNDFGDVDVGGGFGAFSNGVASGDLVFNDVGIIRLAAEVSDYLGTGPIDVLPVNVGRFYPHHFDAVPAGTMNCHTQLPCAAGVNGAAYSKQPFPVQLLARNALGATTRNYRGGFARAAALTAFSAAQGSSANPPSTPAGSVLSAASAAASSFADGVATLTPVYTFPTVNAASTIPPTNVFLRGAETSGTDGVTSKVSSAIEGGLVIVSGRFVASHGYGSELLPMPLRLQAQFFSSSGWQLSSSDNASSLAGTDLTFSGCTKMLAAGAQCKPVLASTSPATVTLQNGVISIRLAAPGAGNYGSANVTPNKPVWLPGVYGRLTFGTYRAPYIYLREMH